MDLDDERKPAATTTAATTTTTATTAGSSMITDAVTYADFEATRRTTTTSSNMTTTRTVTAAAASGGDVAVKPVLIKHGRTASATASFGKNGKQQPSGGGNNNNNNNNKKQSKHLKWDEQAIEEHDLLRGTRMKIDEPNTPYTYYSDSGAESDDSKRQHQKSPAHQKNTISWDSLQNRLDSVANVQQQQQQQQAAQAQQQQQQYPNSPTSSFGGAETDASENGDLTLDHQQSNPDGDDQHGHKKELRKLEFQDHRKRHYNEYQMIQKFRQEHPDDDDEDADEEEGGDEDDDDGDADVED